MRVMVTVRGADALLRSYSTDTGGFNPPIQLPVQHPLTALSDKARRRQREGGGELRVFYPAEQKVTRPRCTPTPPLMQHTLTRGCKSMRRSEAGGGAEPLPQAKDLEPHILTHPSMHPMQVLTSFAKAVIATGGLGSDAMGRMFKDPAAMAAALLKMFGGARGAPASATREGDEKAEEESGKGGKTRGRVEEERVKGGKKVKGRGEGGAGGGQGGQEGGGSKGGKGGGDGVAGGIAKKKTGAGAGGSGGRAGKKQGGAGGGKGGGGMGKLSKAGVGGGGGGAGRKKELKGGGAGSMAKA